MLKTLFKFLGLCNHKWKNILTGDIMHSSGEGSSGTYYHQQCTKCGKLKYVEFICKGY